MKEAWKNGSLIVGTYRNIIIRKLVNSTFIVEFKS